MFLLEHVKICFLEKGLIPKGINQFEVSPSYTAGKQFLGLLYSLFYFRGWWGKRHRGITQSIGYYKRDKSMRKFC